MISKKDALKLELYSVIESVVQNTDTYRSNAEEAIRCIQALQEFATIDKLKDLPEMYQDDNQLSEAAVSPIVMVFSLVSKYCHTHLLVTVHLKFPLKFPLASYFASSSN